MGSLFFAYMQEELLAQARHRTEHGGVCYHTPQTEGFIYFSDSNPFALRSLMLPQILHDLCFQVAKDFADTLPVWSKHGNLWFSRHITPHGFFLLWERRLTFLLMLLWHTTFFLLHWFTSKSFPYA